MAKYSVTIGYKAVFSVNVEAENEKEGRLKAVELFKKKRDAFKSSKISLEDDSYRPEADGIVNMDKTWNEL